MGLPESTGGLLKIAVSKSNKGGALNHCDNYEIVDALRHMHSITRLLAIAGIPRSSYKWRTTQPKRDARQQRDHEVKEHMIAIHVVSPEFGYDITYISDGENFHYLSVIQDLFNNEIVAWKLSRRNDSQLVLDTIEQWTKKETFR